MAKEENQGFLKEFFSTFSEMLTGGIVESLKQYWHEFVSETTSIVQARFERSAKRVSAFLAESLITVLAVVLISLGVVYYLMETLLLSKGLSFMVTGVVLLVIMLIIKLNAR